MSSPFLADQVQPIPGGCDDCDAYQTISEVSPGVLLLTVHHDDTCPQLKAIERQAGT